MALRRAPSRRFSAADEFAQPLGIHREARLVDVDEQRDRAARRDRRGGGDSSVGDGDDVVAGLDPGRDQSQVDGFGARPDADNVRLLAQVVRELAFERFEMLAEDEPTRVDDMVYRGTDRRPLVFELASQVAEGHVHVRASFRSSAARARRGARGAQLLVRWRDMCHRTSCLPCPQGVSGRLRRPAATREPADRDPR